MSKIESLNSSRHQKVGFWSQVAIIFFIVSGGPYGLEGAVGSVGPLWILILLFLIPLFWALPISLMVGELSSIESDQGGYYLWVKRALGPFWAFQEGWWTLCYSSVDLAIYPLLFLTYLSYFFQQIAESPDSQNIFIRSSLSFVFILAAIFMNLRGSLWVGLNKVFEILLVIFPFFLFVVFGIQNSNWENLIILKENLKSIPPLDTHHLAEGIAILIWNFTGWDNATTYSNEVDNPKEVIPRSMFMALLIVFFSYLIPLIIGFKFTINPEDWSQGAGWPDIISKSQFPFIGTMMALAAIISAWALFNSQILYISRVSTAMSKDGLFPHFFEKTLKDQKTPYISILFGGIMAFVFSFMSLGKLMILDILLYSLGLTLEFIALIQLRISEPQTHRPFKIPFNIFGLSIMSLLPLSLSVLLLYFALINEESSKIQISLVFGAILSGIIIYFFQKRILKSSSEVTS